MTVLTSPSDEDVFWMQRALSLAHRGEATVSPNPMVGAVIVKNGRCVGEGWHKRCGGPHAEIVALKQAGPLARGAVMYVTLEPCVHHGRTPPCAPVLVQAGLKRVVAAVRDPNPLVSGRGLLFLKKAGVAVSVGLCRQEAVDLNIGFFTRMTKNRPHITLKSAQTWTGFIAAQEGRRVNVTSRLARAHAHRLRRLFDAICVGAETVRQDDPRLERPHGRMVWHKIVITSQLELPKKMRLMTTGGNTILVCGDRTPSTRIRSWQRLTPVWVCRTLEDGSVDLNDVVRKLADCNINRLLCEGGGWLNGRFLQLNLADRVHLYMGAALFRHANAPMTFNGWQTASWFRSPRLRLRALDVFNEDVFISADVILPRGSRQSV